VKLIFLNLENAALAVQRVAARVAQGGHNVPKDVILRRFLKGKKNFDTIYKKLVDVWALYDNAGIKPKLLEWGENR
jgi:predicted ABC-type ATPase